MLQFEHSLIFFSSAGASKEAHSSNSPNSKWTKRVALPAKVVFINASDQGLTSTRVQMPLEPATIEEVTFPVVPPLGKNLSATVVLLIEVKI